MKKYLPLLFFAMTFCLFLAIFVISGKGILGQSSERTLEYYTGLFDSVSGMGLDQKLINLKKIDAPIIIVNFWATWCLPCVKELLTVQEMYKKWSDKEIFFLAINVDEQKDLPSIHQFKERYGFNFTIMMDLDGRLVKDFQAEQLPLSVIYFRQKAVQILYGAQDFKADKLDNDMRNLINNKN